MQTQTLDVHIVSHTHWDREWYLSYEQFRLRLVSLVDRMLDLLESRPDFRYFHLDGQTIILEDYLEMRPSQEPRLRKLIEDGRVLIGPWYDMPDEFLVSGEALVRNLALGHRISRRFGAPMPVGYLPDLFGHVGQMPQILRNFGLDNAILWRGFGGRGAEYWWQAPDGSKVLMMHLPPEGYCNATRVHFKPELMIERTSKAIEFEASRSVTGQVLLMNGVDHVEPHPIIPELAQQLTSSLGANVMHSTLPAYVNAVRSAVARSGGRLETVSGELRGGEDYANLLPGVLSARVYIKQANARVQTLLEKWAEPLATFAASLGARYPAEELQYAWKTLLQNHPHDSICGCSVDAVHEENMTRFARAQQVAEGIRDAAIERIASAVPAGPDGALRCVAVNPAAQPYAGTIEATVDLPYESAEPNRRVDPEALDAPVTFYPVSASVRAVRTHDGKVATVQVLGEDYVTSFVMSRYETPWALRARRVRIAWAGEVPACGYATFDLLFEDTPASPPARGLRPVGSAERSAENDFLRLLINDDGTVDVVDRRSATRFTRCGALDDVGDVGDEYNYSPPENDRRFTPSEATDVRITRVHAGPVRASFRIDLVLPLPESANPDRSSRSGHRVDNHVSMWVSLDAGSPRVTWDVEVDNRSKDHRLRMLFPTGVDTLADVRAETAFGVVRRPAQREVPDEVKNEVPVNYGPTISFVDAGGAAAGAIAFGEGLMEYEPYPREEASGARVGLTLLRCVGDLSRDDLVTRPSGHAGPGLPTPGAQCPGSHRFRLAFEPRGTEPAAATLFARSQAFLVPPRVVAMRGAGGTAPASHSFLSLEATRGGVVMSACKKAAEGEAWIVRLFNPDSAPATVRMGGRTSAQHAFRTDFLENHVEELPVKGGAVEVSLAPYRIVTIAVA
jgi:alpha-mannosidase